MRRALPLAAFAAVLGGAVQVPPQRFELEIPGFPDQTFRGEIIELPADSLDQVVIHILEPLASRVSYARIFPRVNLQGAAVISQVRSSARGKSVVLNLRMRPDITLGPGVNALEITVFDQNGRRYYRNWILRLREEARNEWFTYEFARGAGEGAPPDVVIEEPAGPLPFSPSGAVKARVRGVVTGRNPLRHLLVDGAAVPLPEKADRAEFDTEVRPDKGQRTVVVEAADVAGHRTRVAIPVGVPEKEAVAPAATADRMGIVIGVSRYQHGSSLLCAPGAQAGQASRISEMLKKAGGFAPERILVLKDDQATLQQLRNALRNAAAAAKPDDLLLIYFGGCGMQDPFQPERFYLAAYDTQPNALADTALELSELEQLLNERVRSSNVLLAFEVSASPLFQDLLGGANLIAMRLLQLASPDAGRSVLICPPAAAPDQQEAAASQFTEALQEALNGKADVNNDRLITTTELVRYVTRHSARTASAGRPVLGRSAAPAVVVSKQNR